MSEQRQFEDNMESVNQLDIARAERAALIEAAGLVSEGVVICDHRGQTEYESDITIRWLRKNDQGGMAIEALNEVLLSARAGQRISRSLEFLGPPRRAFALNGVPVLNEGKQPIGGVAVVENTTERRHHEALLRDFVANVSHELKTPVGALGLLAEALLVETSPEVTSRLVERMQVEAARVTRVIDDLLDLSRIESITAPVREMVSVEAIVTQAVAGVNFISEHRGIEIKVDIEGEPTVYGGMREIISAIHHLLENAIKYSPDGSFVELCAKSDGDWTEISVEDHGLGISPKDVDRIFERFYRVDNARKRTTGGTGLGLSIVRQVIQQHGGDVRVKSQEGEGSTFILRLASKPSVVTERLVVEGGQDG